MKIYGNLDLRTGDLYEDAAKVYGISIVANDAARNALTDVEDGKLAVTLSDYTLNMYDTTSLLWKKFSITDPVQQCIQYNDSKAHILLGTGGVKVPLSNVQYTDRTTTHMLMDVYFKGPFNNWDVIARLTGADNTFNSLALTWNEYYGLCIHVADQPFKDTRIFPTTNAWHHFNVHQDPVAGKLDFMLDGFRIYQTPVVPLVNPTQLRLGLSDTYDGYDTTSLWVNGYQGKICQFRFSTNINRKYVGNSFTLYPHREMPDEYTEIFIQPKGGVIAEDSPNFATPEVITGATYATDDSPFTNEITHNVNSNQHRTFFHNNGATTDIIFNLPPAEDQKVFAFVRFTNSKNIKIRSQYTERIIGTNGDGTAINMNYLMNDETTANSLVVLKGNANHQWEITTIKGTWKNATVYV